MACRALTLTTIMKKHYTIPFFIPHEGCPHKCVFCDQNKITGQDQILPKKIPEKIEKYLTTFPVSDAYVEVGFFGGTFTGLSIGKQRSFLLPVQKYIKRAQVSGIRLSTRPDFIDETKLKFLKAHNVKCIELGVQSMSDKVLSRAKRGYASKDVEKACRMIINNGFLLGFQMMLGLPGSAMQDEYFTARKAKELGASQVRIYPTLVMKDTVLADEWREGKYTPLSEKEAISRSVKLLLYFSGKDIKVIRCGLHPSEGLLNGNSFLTGPFHPAFRMKVESRIFGMMLDSLLENKREDIRQISFNPQDEAALIGYRRENLKRMEKLTGSKQNFFTPDAKVPRRTLKISPPLQSLKKQAKDVQ
ncbi:MAG: radical SAM protein [Candidatus Omnitrophica bacterium]|nr:radical SAM protein [Candidatus Omnitrophota bacterium]